MKKLLLLLLIPVLVPAPYNTAGAQAVTLAPEPVEEAIHRSEVEFWIHFLAADEFLGRETGTRELDLAARFVAEFFRARGVEKPEGYETYFQEVPLLHRASPEEITFSAGDSTYRKGDDLVLLSGYGDITETPVVFLDYATEEEIAEHDVDGKLVISRAGLPDHTTPRDYFMAVSRKNEWARNAGAKAVIEIYSNPQFPWSVLLNFVEGDRIEADSGGEDPIPHYWMNGVSDSRLQYLSELQDTPVSLTLSGGGLERFTSRNVIGVIRGTDPELRDEYLMLGAHYDHVGVEEEHPEPITGEYIYNGARDNATGVAGIMSAAKYFAEHPPKRSVIFAAWTAEEIGLTGSRYYSENPAIPLEQTVYHLNIDGAGYNDTTKVTVIGLGRTEADEELISAAKTFGLEAIPDPVPEQNLFDRSDNVNFAGKGIPAPTYSLGITAFDEEINRYYHQPADEADTIDYDYVIRYIRSFVLAAQKIANREEAPFWIPGDVYEEAGKELYGRE